MKKQADAEKFLELITELDDDILLEALVTDDCKKLKDLASKKKPFIIRPVFLKIAAMFLCIAIVAASIVLEKIDKNSLSNYTGNNSFVSKGPALNEKNSSSEASSKKAVSSSKENISSSSDKKNKNPYTSSEKYNKDFSSDDYDPYEWEYIPDEEDSSSDETNNNYYIDSIDKLNFYAVKKTIEECGGVLPLSQVKKPFIRSVNSKLSPIRIMPLADSVVYYEVNRNTVFNITMEIYFTITLNNPKGFLAQKLGGIGLVEVVITENNLDNLITFKRGEKYYSCLLNSGSPSQGPTKRTASFSSHKYISGYNIVKNFEQENFNLNVHFNNMQIVGFDVTPRSDESYYVTYTADDVTFIEGFCVVMFIKRSFTIAQLEKYFK